MSKRHSDLAILRGVYFRAKFRENKPLEKISEFTVDHIYLRCWHFIQNAHVGIMYRIRNLFTPDHHIKLLTKLFWLSALFWIFNFLIWAYECLVPKYFTVRSLLERRIMNIRKRLLIHVYLNIPVYACTPNHTYLKHCTCIAPSIDYFIKILHHIGPTARFLQIQNVYVHVTCTRKW